MYNLANEQYWLTNILLADSLALTYGLHRGAAIKRCAKRMRDHADSSRLQNLARLMINAKPEKLMKMVDGLFIEMKKDGLLI